MKIKQKKLKAENFRYVTKEIIKNPMVYLDDFFRSQTNIEYWLRDINLLINAAAYSDLANPEFQENGYHAKRLIEQMEVAYIIYKQCNLKTQSKPLKFFKTREDYNAYWFKGEYTVDGKVSAADSLSKVFSFQSLEEWYETLDDFWLYASQPRENSYERFGDRILAIRELLLRMAWAMSDIYGNGGISVRVPFYFIACAIPSLTIPSDDLLDEEVDPDQEADGSGALVYEPEEIHDALSDVPAEAEIENHQTERQ